MSTQQGIIEQLASRYAAALFALVQESPPAAQDRIRADIEKLTSLCAESKPFRQLIRSPITPAAVQAKAMHAILQKAEMDAVIMQFVSVVAKNRRAFALPHMLAAYTALEAKASGQMNASIIAPAPLSATHETTLKAQLKKAFGKHIHIDTKIDPSLLGGLIVRAGSLMIDGSLRAKLNSLKQAMKEVG